jgi:hypothetical protein
MTHTPGPWTAVLPDDARGQPVPYYRGLVALVSCETGGAMSVVTDGRDCSKSEWEANARLIARAPEMLDLLRDAEQWIVLHAPAELRERVRELLAEFPEATT